MKITIDIPDADVDDTVAALDFVLEGHAHIYAAPTPEEEADYNDTDKALRRDYVLLEQLTKALALATGGTWIDQNGVEHRADAQGATNDAT